MDKHRFMPISDVIRLATEGDIAAANYILAYVALDLRAGRAPEKASALYLADALEKISGSLADDCSLEESRSLRGCDVATALNLKEKRGRSKRNSPDNAERDYQIAIQVASYLLKGVSLTEAVDKVADELFNAFQIDMDVSTIRKIYRKNLPEIEKEWGGDC